MGQNRVPIDLRITSEHRGLLTFARFVLRRVPMARTLVARLGLLSPAPATQDVTVSEAEAVWQEPDMAALEARASPEKEPMPISVLPGQVDPSPEPALSSADDVASSLDQELSDWLPAFSVGQDYADLIRRFSDRDGSITLVRETAMLYAIIQRLHPKWSLEIGTFFAHTTRIMAEAIVDAGFEGKIFTLDPFGAERVPGILGIWPAPLQAVTEFRPHNSMQYFLDLETLGIPKGADSPLGFVFVDGHHNFEYAIFDILRSADHLRPGGAIAVDNLEQEGPKMALIQFLRWNPAWRLFYGTEVLDPDEVDLSMFPEAYNEEIGEASKTPPWGILLAPPGVQVSRHPVKFMKRGVPYLDVGSLGFNVRYMSHAGTLHVNISYYAIPFDFHITGKGMSLIRSEGKCVVPSEHPAKVRIRFDSPLVLNIDRLDMTNVCYELEVSYKSEISDNAYVLLEGGEPFSLES